MYRLHIYIYFNRCQTYSYVLKKVNEYKQYDFLQRYTRKNLTSAHANCYKPVANT